MDIDFWHQRWADGRLGFHQAKVNSRLKTFWRAFAAAERSDATVLVPLCGKSLDMLWLARAGHRVLGVEISDIACRGFFVENGLRYEVETGARFVRYVGGVFYIGDGVDGKIELWRGDWFDLTPDDLSDVRLVYDRAALIALPRTMRADYAARLAALLQPQAQVFLIGMDYDERKMKGPPFSVPEAEVRGLFGADFSVEIIIQSSGPDIVGNLAERGLDSLNEKVYRLERL